MTDPDPAARIDAALARIERSVAAHGQDRAALARRHAQLRDRVAAAIAAIDDLTAAPGPAA